MSQAVARMQTHKYMPISEQALLERARAFDDALSFDDLTTEYLAHLTQLHTIDFATALLYDRIRRAPWNSAFCEQMDAPVNMHSAQPAAQPVLIAPGALYREQPRFGSDGHVVRAAAGGLGWPTRVVDVDSMGSVAGNAAILAKWLAAQRCPVIIASLSKGGSDLRVALERQPELCDKITCWLNICGLIRGTPISDSLLGTRWWQRGLLNGYLAYTNADAQFVADLAATPGSLLGEPLLPEIAERLRVINVVAFPLSRHLQGSSRGRHQRMARLGPNDGTALLRDEMVLPGLIYPVWGADHFMRVGGIESLMRRLLLHAGGCHDDD